MTQDRLLCDSADAKGTDKRLSVHTAAQSSIYSNAEDLCIAVISNSFPRARRSPDKGMHESNSASIVVV